MEVLRVQQLKSHQFQSTKCIVMLIVSTGDLLAVQSPFHVSRRYIATVSQWFHAYLGDVFILIGIGMRVEK